MATFTPGPSPCALSTRTTPTLENGLAASIRDRGQAKSSPAHQRSDDGAYRDDASAAKGMSRKRHLYRDGNGPRSTRLFDEDIKRKPMIGKPVDGKRANDGYRCERCGAWIEYRHLGKGWRMRDRCRIAAMIGSNKTRRRARF
jgi:hypothetical protein